MSRPDENATARRLSFLIRPLSLQHTMGGAAFALTCALALAGIYLVDTSTRRGVTIAGLSALPLLGAGWLLSRRVTFALTIFAILLRILAIANGGVYAETGIVQAFQAAAFAFIGRVAAEHFARTQAAGEHAALLSRVAAIATSSDRLNLILYGVLDELTRHGYGGGLVALLDERGELYPAAADGSIDREVLEERLLAVSSVMERSRQEGRSILIREYEAPASPGGRNIKYRPRCVLAVPLRSAGTILGVLEIDDANGERFDDEDCNVMEQVALALSGAVQRAGALQLADSQLRRRLKDLGLLLETAREMSSSLDFEHITKQVVRSAAELISHAGRSGVRASLFKVDGDLVTFLADYDQGGVRLVNEHFPLHQHRGLVRALESGHAATWDFKDSEEPLASLVRKAGVTSGAFAPVRTGTTVFGVLSAASRDEREFEAEELRLLEGIADLAGLAISNSERLGLEMTRSQQLRDYADRMQALEKTKSEFLRLASHELRGPITILRGYISMLNEGTLGELPDATRHVLPTLTEKIADMNHLIDQMLETARLEDTRLQLNLELVDLSDLVAAAAAGLESKARAGNCRLVIDLPGESNGSSPESARVSVLADRNRVATIIANLLDNAIKYSPDGGEVHCMLAAQGGKAVVTVTDQGIGIDAEDFPRLFTRFGRIVTPDNSHIPGTGLGLYLSRELARMHGGDITATSERGEGSTFVLTLPIAVERLHRLATQPADVVERTPKQL